MNLDKSKQEVKDLLGKRVIITYSIGRNKEELIEGTIDKLYKSVFTVKTTHYTRSFSYQDVLTKDIIIKKL